MKSLVSSTLPQRFLKQSPSMRGAMKLFDNEFDRLFRNGDLMEWASNYDGYDFSPPCNVKEDGKSFSIRFDIPGIKKEDVKIQIEDNRLTVSGERKFEREEEDEKHFITESHFGSFMRVFNLPFAVDQSKVDARCEDGVLTIKIPKVESSKSKEVKIH